MEYAVVFIILACIFGTFMAWGIGANDVANAMGTSVGSGALTIKHAIIVAVIFEFAGAYLAGGEVTSTIRKDLFEPLAFQDHPEYLVYGMLSSLLAAAIWLLIASVFGWPVSTTHSIVGAIVGFAAVGISIDAVNWAEVSSIVLSWVVSPLVSGTIAFLLFLSVQKLILNTETPFKKAKKYVPYYMLLVGFIISMVTLVKGLKHVDLEISVFESLLYSVGIGLTVFAIGSYFIAKIKADEKADKKFHFSSVEKVFGVLMVCTASAMAFAHGSNDVANAIGPLAAVVGVVQSNGDILAESRIPLWILLLGGGGIIVGLTTYGYRVIATIGKHITELTPSRGFAAELAAATTVVLASGTGLPISTTHTLVGAVLGVGLARGFAALNLKVVTKIFISWIVTLPAGAALSILFFYFFKGLFG